MVSAIIPLNFLLYSLFLLQCLQTEGHLKIIQEMQHDHEWNKLLRSKTKDSGIKMHDHDHTSSSSNIEPELNVFFHYNDLKLGNKMSIYFPKQDHSTSPHLLSRDESNSIPFSSSQFPYILHLFSFSEESKQAKAMKDTLHHCELPAMEDETKFCATSLESMLDSLTEIFGSGSKFSVLTTSYLSESISLLQNYTVCEAPVEISSTKIVGCHTLPYPYRVFYCHSQESDNKLYKVLLEGDDGGRVEAAAMCHMNTSQWDPNCISYIGSVYYFVEMKEIKSVGKDQINTRMERNQENLRWKSSQEFIWKKIKSEQIRIIRHI